MSIAECSEKVTPGNTFGWNENVYICHKEQPAKRRKCVDKQVKRQQRTFSR